MSVDNHLPQKSIVNTEELFPRCLQTMDLYKRNVRKSVSWETFLEASEALLIGSRDDSRTSA